MHSIEGALRMSDEINAQFGFERAFGKTNGNADADTKITKFGISFNSDGTTTFFAQLEKSSASQKEYLEKLQEKKAAERKRQAYSPIAHGEILNQPQIKEMADKYNVSVPQLCIRYTLQLGAISLPKTGNPAHMKTNADVDFEISAEDMEVLKHFKKIESYGANSGFPVYGGRL